MILQKKTASCEKLSFIIRFCTKKIFSSFPILKN